MHLASPNASETRITLEMTVDMVNALENDELDARVFLTDRGFSRAPQASAASLQRVAARMSELAPLIHALPELDVSAATARINEQLTDLPISPSVVDHGGVGPHMHWTPSTATFDDQVMSDVLMSLALEICDRGNSRFGRCDASDCNDLYYDCTRNGSRRFCANPRCASRTHTADHRARTRKSTR